MPTIIAHPDNINALRARLDSGEFDRPGGLFQAFTVRADKFMERDKPTGRYVMPSGLVVDREEVFWGTPFVDYGPDDIPLLLFLGIIREDRELLFYVLDESRFRVWMDHMPIVTPRWSVLMTCTV